MTDDFFKGLMELFNNPLFKKTCFDYIMFSQREGLETAQKYWSSKAKENMFFVDMPVLVDQMSEFYSAMGFVSRKKYDEVLEENSRLKKENAFLRDTIQQLNLRVMTEGGMKMQEAWKETVDKQMEISKEITKNFFEIFKLHDKK